MIRLAFIDLGTKPIQFFAEVSKSLAPDVHACFYCAKPKPLSIAQRLGLDAYAADSSPDNPGPLPPEAEQKILNAKIIAENPDRQRLGNRLHKHYHALQRFLEQRQIDAVFLWNGSGLLASTASYLAQQRNLKTIYGENGYFYDTIQLDPEGVNQAASVTNRIAEEYRKTAIDPIKLEQLRAMLEAYRNDKPPQYSPQTHKVRASLSARIAGEFNNLLESDLRYTRTLNKTVPVDPGTLPDKYVFIPLQVVKDSQLLLYSPLVGNDMELFIASCHSAIEQVAGDYRVLVKLHPADLRNVDYTEMMRKYPDIIWLKDYPANKLIKAASLVITINSTVGVEALIHDKPVITLGDNFYNVPEVVHHVNSLEELPQAINSALSVAPDKQHIQRFLYYLYHHYFTHGSWKNYAPQSIESVARKLRSLLDVTT
jgi:capsular polysaccharide export protein